VDHTKKGPCQKLIRNTTLGIVKKPQMIKNNVDLNLWIAKHSKTLLMEYMDSFTWSYKDLKGIPPHIAQHKIELYITIPFH
jgi:hypothetical protein